MRYPKDGDGLTQFGQALAELNVDIICANRPSRRRRVKYTITRDEFSPLRFRQPEGLPLAPSCFATHRGHLPRTTEVSDSRSPV